jgi:hypothetical protein
MNAENNAVVPRASRVSWKACTSAFQDEGSSIAGDQGGFRAALFSFEDHRNNAAPVPFCRKRA